MTWLEKWAIDRPGLTTDERRKLIQVVEQLVGLSA